MEEGTEDVVDGVMEDDGVDEGLVEEDEEVKEG